MTLAVFLFFNWECSPRDALPTEEVLVTDGEQGGLQEVGDL